MPIKKKKVTDNSEDNSNANKRRSIKKTEVKDVTEKNPQESTPQTNSEKADNALYTETTIDLIMFFGEDIINSLKTNKYLKIPFTYNDISPEEWLLKALKTILSEDDIKEISRNIHAKYYALVNDNDKLKAELKKLNEILVSKQKDIDKNEDLSDKLFHENKTVKQELEKSVNLALVMKSIFTKEEHKGFLRLTLEAIEDNAGKETTAFILAFLKEWMQLIQLKIHDVEEEKKVEEYDLLLRDFLLAIKDIHIPQRRSLLDALARYINKEFLNFEFISPEETTQIDIDLHRVLGKGGNKIKQGLSFAVIRKENRKTYKYADIETL